MFVPEIAVSMSDVRFDVSPRRPPTAAEIVSLAWIGSARRTARSRCARIAREQLGADDHRADAEHPPRVERRALGRPDPARRHAGATSPIAPLKMRIAARMTRAASPRRLVGVAARSGEERTPADRSPTRRCSIAATRRRRRRAVSDSPADDRSRRQRLGRGGAPRPGLRAAAGRHGQPGARPARRACCSSSSTSSAASTRSSGGRSTRSSATRSRR